MSGHSKWANIKHKKARNDEKRGKVFSKLVKEIMVAAKMGGSDIDGNPRLRTAVDKAKGLSVPKENIDRAIKKGAGELADVTYHEGYYEGYGPGGIAVLVTYMTDNKNRTVSDVRGIFNKSGGALAESGAVAWMFDKKGMITFPIEVNDEDTLMDEALEAGADDVVRNDDDGVFEVFTAPEDYLNVKDAFDKKELKYEMSDVIMIPKNTVKVPSEHVKKLLKLLEDIEDLDDVQAVDANFDIDPADLEGLE